MYKFLVFIFTFIANLFPSKKALSAEVTMLRQENQILRRHCKKRMKSQRSDRLIFSLLNEIHNISDQISIFKVETVLGWKNQLIKSFWTYKHTNKGGRPATPKETKKQVIDIKNSGLYWGYKKIKGELQKIGIFLDSTTIANIIREARKRGKIKKSLDMAGISTGANRIYLRNGFLHR